VRDTGIGISAELLPKIFDLFTQVDTLSARVQGGLGIGLTLVKHMVGLHGGSLKFIAKVSAKAVSSLSVYLPLPNPYLQGNASG
jgi:signal transduction histidine kinase